MSCDMPKLSGESALPVGIELEALADLKERTALARGTAIG